jgi:hypothetical protein
LNDKGDGGGAVEDFVDEEHMGDGSVGKLGGEEIEEGHEVGEDGEIW